jgi:hypothetical protein
MVVVVEDFARNERRVFTNATSIREMFNASAADDKIVYVDLADDEGSVELHLSHQRVEVIA